MQNKVREKSWGQIPVPRELMEEAGIDENSVLQMYVYGNRLVIASVRDADGYRCDFDCERCPVTNECKSEVKNETNTPNTRKTRTDNHPV
jgi:bifunctional DNA-binding transcriptional regulator/antitoxin component of YhaV-PrlF toxin-antitoxin module